MVASKCQGFAAQKKRCLGPLDGKILEGLLEKNKEDMNSFHLLILQRIFVGESVAF